MVASTFKALTYEIEPRLYGEQKISSMFPVVDPKSAMHDAVLIFNFINR